MNLTCHLTFPKKRACHASLIKTRYSRGSEFVTVSVTHRFPFFLPYRFLPRSRTLQYPFLSLTVGRAKRTETLILTVCILVFDREPYRTKMETVIRLLLRTAISTLPVLVPYGSRCVSYHKNLQRLSIHRTNFVAVPRTVPHQNW